MSGHNVKNQPVWVLSYGWIIYMNLPLWGSGHIEEEKVTKIQELADGKESCAVLASGYDVDAAQSDSQHLQLLPVKFRYG